MAKVITLHAALEHSELAKYAQEKQMARKKPENEMSEGGSTPSRQDESDIVKEVGATPANDGSGELEVDETKIREVGAVDAESVLENRRSEEMVGKVRAGQKGVLFNLDNILEKYDLVIKTWPPSTIDILVNRVTGKPVQWVIQSRPKSGADLYTAILANHGHAEEAEYEVRIIDATGKQRRGTGRITMPDTRETPPTQQQPQQGQPLMNYPYGQQPPQQPPTAQAPTVDPVAMMGKMFEIFRQMQPAQPTVVPQPTPAPPPASFPGQSTDPMAVMSKAFEMFQQMQRSAQPQPVAAQPQQPMQPSTDPMAVMSRAFEMFQQMQPQPQPGQPAQPGQPPPASPSTDPMAVMQESFRLFQQMQPQPQAQAPVPPPPSGSDPGTMMAWMMSQMLQQKMQPQPAPQPSVDPMAVMSKAFEMFQTMQRAVQPPSPPPPGPGQGPYQRPYGSSRPYYGQGQGPQDDRYPPQHDPRYPPQQQPPPRPKTAAEEFKDAASVIDMAMNLADRFRPPAATTEPDRDRDRDRDDDNPVKVVKVGEWPIVVNRDDGSTRKWETGVALLPNLLKWAAEQREAVMKAQAERDTKRQRQQQPLPPGYVEVTEGYKPPPGYVAVPVEMGQGQGLPPAPDPSEMPPPLTQQEERPRPSRTWGAPPIPGSEG